MSEFVFPMGPVRSVAARWGAVVALLTAGYDCYGVFGDSKASASQHDSLPFVIAMGLLVAAVVFGLLVPAGLRAIHQGARSASTWALAHGITAVLSLALFWSGLPLILGTGAVLLGTTGRRSGVAPRQMAIARGLGIFAIVASVAISVIGNVLHN